MGGMRGLCSQGDEVKGSTAVCSHESFDARPGNQTGL